jgi:8-oxo-dGTP diphosphatase
MTAKSGGKSPAISDFPTVRWGEYSVTFEPIVEPVEPRDGPAIVVFARAQDGYVLANVRGRGWCTPSGRLEPGESHWEAAVRETYEEAGARLEKLTEFGRYVLRNENSVTLRFPTFYGYVQEFGDIPPGSESEAAMCVPFNEVRAVYYRWDELLDRVFNFVDRLTKSG